MLGDEVTAKRNSSLQGAYLVLAARALGLDCGPMSGFDNAKLDEEFLTEMLVSYGFEKVDFVYEPGQFAIRGGIIDIFSFGSSTKRTN